MIVYCNPKCVATAKCLGPLFVTHLQSWIGFRVKVKVGGRLWNKVGVRVGGRLQDWDCHGL